MNIEGQLTSLELSKRLMELGVRQDAVYSWLQDSNGTITCGRIGAFSENIKSICSAFSGAELGNILARAVKRLNPETVHIEMYWIYGQWHVVGNDIDSHNIRKCADKLVDAMAELVIHMIEHKMLDVWRY